jgi:hypothetical protein
MLAVGALGVAIWRLAVGDARVAGVFAIFSAVWGLNAFLGWRVRANEPDDPWEPR